MDYKALLSKRVAGIPVAALALVVALVLLYAAVRLKPSDPTDSEGDQESLPDDIEGSDDTSYSDTAAVPIFLANPSATAGDVVTPTSDTNEAWAIRAINYLVSTGVDVTEAGRAIQAFVSGDNLTYQQNVLVKLATTQNGVPPESITYGAVGNYRGPASKQGEPPTTHTVKGKSDDTYSELARLYYGLTNADAIQLLRSKNTATSEPFAVGVKVAIPKFHRPRYDITTRSMRTLYQIAAKNGTTPDQIQALNPGRKFPLPPKTRVQVA